MRNKIRFAGAAFLVICFVLLATACVHVPNEANEHTALSTPAYVRVEGGELTWNPVEYASGYTVKINEATYMVTENRYSLESLPSGTYSISVKANGDGILFVSSGYSESISYTSSKTPNDPLSGDSVVGTFGSFDEINTRESYLGYGIDVVNASAVTSKNVKMNYPIFDTEKLLNERLLKSNEHYSSFESIEALSIEEFSKNMSNSTNVTSGRNVSAAGKIDGVKASASAAFSRGLQTKFTKTTEEVESQYFLEVIAENQSYWLVLQSTEARYKEILSDEFKRDLYNTSVTPAQLFDKYGTHLITSVAMGGNICMYYTFYTYEKTTTRSTFVEISSELKSNIGLAFGGQKLSAGMERSFENTFTYTQTAKQNRITIDTFIESAGGGSYGINSIETLYSKYFDWQQSLDKNPVVIGIKDSNSLYPIWNLLDLNVPGAAERFAELYGYFQTYGSDAYDELCELYGITPAIAPTGITNVRPGSVENYQEGQIVQVKSGDTMQISFDVLPENAAKYQKLYSSSDPDNVTIDADGILRVLPSAESGRNVTITVSAGAISKQISLYIINSHNVLFNTGVASLSVDPLLGIPDGYHIDEPVLEREGWLLNGWYLDRNFTQPFDFDVDVICGNLTLYAKWTRITPTLTYKPNGGSELPSKTVEYNSIITEPKAPTRTGYRFAGWYKDEDLVFSFDFNQPLTEDVTVWASWEKIEYTVAFDTKGGVRVGDAVTDVEKGYLIEQPFTSRTGYTLDGWYRDDNFLRKFFFNETVTESITLYAKWTPVNVVVSFEENDGGALYDQFEIEIVPQSTDIEKNYFLSSVPQPVKTGYTHVGWLVNGEQMTSEQVAAHSFVDSQRLVALWVPNKYSITYRVNGELFAEQTEFYTYGQSLQERLLQPSEEGYSFSSWKWGTLDAPATMPAENVTLDAVKTPNEYTVTYFVDAEQYAQQTYVYGETILYLAEPTTDGKDFSGWTYNNQSELPETMPAKNITVEGNFDRTLFLVRYYVNGELEHNESVYSGNLVPAYTQVAPGYELSAPRYKLDPDSEDYVATLERMPKQDVWVYLTKSPITCVITVEYRIDGKAAPEITERHEVAWGESYSFPLHSDIRNAAYYSADRAVIAGTATSDKTESVTVEIKTYMLTITKTDRISEVKYRIGDGDEKSLGQKSNDMIRVKYGTEIRFEVIPAEGYSFERYTVTTMPAADYGFTPNAVPKQYTVTFMDGQSVFAEQTFDFGSVIASPASAPTKKGNTFTGWKNLPDRMPANDLTVQAGWKVNSYTINFNLNAGTIKTTPGLSSAQPFSATYGTKPTLPAATASEYAFKGWRTGDGVLVTDGNGALKADVADYTDGDGNWICDQSVTLYADWEQVRAGIYLNQTDFRNGTAANAMSSADSSQTIWIVEDIDLGGAAWEKIGVFVATLDGMGHSIYNFTITASSVSSATELQVGFIGYNYGIIRSLTIGRVNATTTVTATLTHDRRVQLNLGGIACWNYGTMENCVLTNVELSATVQNTKDSESGKQDAFLRIGGIVSHNGASGRIVNCTVDASFVAGLLKKATDDGVDNDGILGGICAINYGTVTGCKISGKSRLYLEVKGDGKKGNTATPRGLLGCIVGAQEGSNKQALLSDCTVESGTYQLFINYGSYTKASQLCALYCAYWDNSTPTGTINANSCTAVGNPSITITWMTTNSSSQGTTQATYCLASKGYDVKGG